MILPDLLAPNLQVVFCGTAASDISARMGAYYANPSNRFWRALHEVGLTPRLLAPQDYRLLLDYGIGLTDMAKEAHGVDARLAAHDYAASTFETVIRQFQPTLVAFTSKKAASVYLGRRTGTIGYGLQQETIDQTRLWVLPSPSGAASRYWDVRSWQALADEINEKREPRTP